MREITHFGRQLGGKSQFMRECAVAAARAGQKVLLVESLGNVRLEPYTGNVAGVSLNETYGGLNPSWIETDGVREDIH